MKRWKCRARGWYWSVRHGTIWQGGWISGHDFAAPTFRTVYEEGEPMYEYADLRCKDYGHISSSWTEIGL